ncbi:MAG: RidA family protein, partial [Candidatus Contubernalis sp.]|nr:RidA family protein [Candidatus Contubernalis sp.]
MEIEDRIREMGLKITETPKPLASYVPAVKVGNIVYTSGQLPLYGGKLTAQGKVGQEVTLEDASGAAKICALKCLSAVKGLGIGLEEIKKIIKVNGYVNSSPGFTGQPQVINGASNFLLEVFGDQGIHARAAVGVS